MLIYFSISAGSFLRKVEKGDVTDAERLLNSNTESLNVIDGKFDEIDLSDTDLDGCGDVT